MQRIYLFLTKNFPDLFYIPPDVDLRFRRWIALGNVAYPFCIFLHGIFIPTFGLLGIPEMAFFNVGSCILFMICIMISKRGYMYAGFVMGCIEVFIHACLATYFIGWESGFHYLIFGATACIYLAPPGRYALKFTLFLSSAIGYLVLHYTAHSKGWMVQNDPAVVYWFSVANILTLFAILAMWAYSYSYATTKAEEAFEIEHNRSEALLHNILPKQIVKQLKRKQGTIVDSFRQTSILFCDIVNFTEISKRTDPQELINILNDVFSQIDDLVEKHDLEKIKTIGDSYMVASGVPTPIDNHAEKIADLAVEIMETFKNIMLRSGEKLQIRIGICSGEVVAGVIGKKKFSYDLWGDSVNMAARMESTGVPGRIHVHESVFKLLREKFNFEKRSNVEIKGKGLTTTYFLLGRRTVYFKTAS